MCLLTTPQAGRRLRSILAIAALMATATAILFVPRLALLPLLFTALVVVWDRLAIERDLRRLAASVADVQTEAKLEITGGAWGELCHAVNRLRQQRRATRQLQRLLPELPPVEDLLEADLPPEGLPCDIAALAIALPEGPPHIARLREAAALAADGARRHEGLLMRFGQHLVVVFGVTGRQGPATLLRNAHQTARAMHSRWNLDATRRPRLALVAGQARLAILPGLGLSVIGPPVEQALALLNHADEDLLLCNEEAYLGLRRLGLAPIQFASQRPITGAGHPDAYAIPL
ncbi:MAG: hypothetical protein RMK84_06360 [Oscillochloridaceae bacterium]|nr:hypothetical protein [Chloroflexaceae bacterium]MDW8389730.1 hypothetical protein [Oscillochloridaceae bacterium]